MGANQSTSTVVSYSQYQNDFELVIRATKDLEHLLETGFGAPNGMKDGLHDKISHVQKHHGLSQATVKKMRYLVTLRNKLVHDKSFNALPDRQGFASSFESVEKELRAKLAEKKKRASGNDNCIIM